MSELNFIVTFSILTDKSDSLYIVKTDGKFNVLSGITREKAKSYKKTDVKDGFSGVRYDFDTEQIFVNATDRLLVLDKDLKLIECKIIGNQNHGLCVTKDEVYVVSSFEGKIYCLNKSDLELKSIIEHKDTKQEYKYHVNSIDIKGNLKALTIHNREDKGYVTGILDDSEFLLHDNLSQPHDFMFTNEDENDYNGMIVCDSANSSVLYMATPIEDSWEKKLQNYTRGICILPYSYMIGTSTNRSRRSAIYKIQEEIDNTIFELDKKNGNIIDSYKFERDVVGNEIYGIAAMYDKKEFEELKNG